MSSWTKSHHGVMHLNGLRPGFQVTVTEMLLCSTVYIIAPAKPFSAAEETVFNEPETAKLWGEEAARRYGAFA